MSSLAFATLLTAFLLGADAAAVKPPMHADYDQIDGQTMQSEKQALKRYRARTHMGGLKDKKSANDTATVGLHLFYETRCPDCVMFINNTLEPLWRDAEMKKHIDITMNPYGNAMSLPVTDVSAGYKFWHPETTKTEWPYVHICQHGTDECLGNMIQTCAQNFATQEQHMEFVFCMAAVPNWGIEKASYDCMTKNNIDTKLVKDCVESPEGNQLFADYGKITAAVQGRQGTPWILIDGATLEDPSNLLQSVCKSISSQAGDGGPSICNGFGSETPAPEQNQDAGPDFTVLTKEKKREFFALDRNNI